MPLYTFRDMNTGEQFDEMMSISSREEYLKDNPHITTYKELADINAQNLLDLTASAQNQLWNRYRDEAAWLIQQREAREARAHQAALQAQALQAQGQQVLLHRSGVYADRVRRLHQEVTGAVVC